MSMLSHATSQLADLYGFLSKPVVRVTLCGMAVALAFLLDGFVADLCAKPIRSGQVRATLTNLRCWGEGPTLLMITLGIAFAIPKKRKVAVMALLLALVTAAVVEVAKPVFHRMRPDEARANVAGGTWQFRPGRNSSFPSGHTATAFAFGRGMTAIIPNLRPICLLAAAGTATSRMHEQRHYFSDCLVGAMLGWGLTGFLWRRIPGVESRLKRFFAIGRSGPNSAETQDPHSKGRIAA